MHIAFFGSSLVSAYWNGAATYYRGIIRALAERGHEVTFYEPDAWERQQHRDMEDPPWARVVVYPATEEAALRCVDVARDSDVVIKASGVGVFDELLEEAVVSLKNTRKTVVFWDVDAPATLERVLSCPGDAFRALIPRFDAVFTYGGGDRVVRTYEGLGARMCVPIYNALDPSTHFRVPPEPRFRGDLAFLGNRLPDREARVEEFFFKPAEQLPDLHFLLGGAGWGDKPRSPNVTYFDHVYTPEHNAFNSTPRAVINISRESMASYGYSPATRVFEAAGAGACIVTDRWNGVEMFFEPEREILVAASGDDVVRQVGSLTSVRAREIGKAALKRVLAEHTYARRAELAEAILDGRSVAAGVAL